MSLENLKRILLIINPRAGKSKPKSKMADLAGLFCESGYMTTVVLTTLKGDATSIAKNYASDYDMIACYGGDGTLNEIISGLLQADIDIPVGYIPAGSTNDMAKTLHLPRNIKKSAGVVLNGTPSGHDVGLFNGNIYFSYIASFGAFTKVSYATPQWLKNIFGHTAYIMNGLKSIGELHPYRLKVKADDYETEGEFLFGSITNSTSVAGLFQLDGNDVCLDDGRFEVILIKNPSSVLERQCIIYGLLNQIYDEKYIIFLHSKKVTLSFEDKAAWTVDGEFAGQYKHAEIKNLKGAIQIIQ